MKKFASLLVKIFLVLLATALILATITFLWLANEKNTVNAEMDTAIARAKDGGAADKVLAASFLLNCERPYWSFAKEALHIKKSIPQLLTMKQRCDASRGRELLNQAVSMGNGLAAFLMVQLEESNEARGKLMRMAAEHGYQDAQLQLGREAFTREPPDFAEAYFWFTVATPANDKPQIVIDRRTARDLMSDAEKNAADQRIEDWLKQTHNAQKR
jgi:hypothetical protein